MMGLTISFNQNSCGCRLWFSSKDEINVNCKENVNKIRTLENYQQQLNLNDPSTTGIKNKSVFDRIWSFNFVSSPSVDIMHDLFEGTCYFQLTEIILYCIEQSFFSLDDLNNRKSLFDYGFYEIANLSVDTTLIRSLKRKENSKWVCITNDMFFDPFRTHY